MFAGGNVRHVVAPLVGVRENSLRLAGLVNALDKSDIIASGSCTRLHLKSRSNIGK